MEAAFDFFFVPQLAILTLNYDGKWIFYDNRRRAHQLIGPDGHYPIHYNFLSQL